MIPKTEKKRCAWPSESDRMLVAFDFFRLILTLVPTVNALPFISSQQFCFAHGRITANWLSNTAPFTGDYKIPSGRLADGQWHGGIPLPNCSGKPVTSVA